MGKRVSKSLVRVLLGSTLASAGFAALAAQPATGTVTADQLTPVPQGISASVLANAVPQGSTSPSTKMRVSFVLKGRNISSLASMVNAGWRGSYLTVPQFAAEYGQAPYYVYALTAYLNSFGIRTQVMPDLLDITTQGTAAQYEKALTILMQDFTVSTKPAGAAVKSSTKQEVYGTKDMPKMPHYLANRILAILGLSNYAPFQSLSVPGIKQPAPQSAGSANAAPFAQLPAAFESQYNLTPLTSAGNAGQGQTMAIVTLASLNPEVPYTFWSKVAHVPVLPGRIHLVNVDGGAGPVSLALGSDETTLDVEQSGAIAPQANIVVYQAPNTDYGFVDAFYQAASDNMAGSISASWGESETAIQASVASGQESPAYAEAFNQAFLESAAQGQSVFVASGDQGAYDPTGDIGTTNLGIDNPSDSPFDTSVGGTTLPGVQTYPITNSSGSVVGSESVNIPSQITWGWDYLWPMYQALGASSEASLATNLVIGSGGGYSSLFYRPSYQNNLMVQHYSDYMFLNSIDPQVVAPGIIEPTKFSFNSNPPLAQGMQPNGRATPDISFNADPQTGYVVYDPQFTAYFGSSLVDFGGTSFIGPQLNGVSAVYESALGGQRVGFWNPMMYRFATSASSPFTALDSNQIYGSSYYSGTLNGAPLPVSGEFANSNNFYTGRSGAVYNPGSGLGYANLNSLYQDFKASLGTP